MTHRGYSHINLATTDLDGTRDFYEGVLGFPMVAAGIYKVEEGGRLRHAYFDIGAGQLLSFIEPDGIQEVPDDLETGINPALGVPGAFYHLAFEAGDHQELAAKQEVLRAKGVAVTEIVDHDWAYSIYFRDPVNSLTLEYACYTRELVEEDAALTVRFEIPFAAVESMTQPQPTPEEG